jgi:hypothetical protein
MTARNDVSRVDWVQNWVLPATGTTLLGQLPTNTVQTIQGTFSVQALLGLDNLSITFQTQAGSTAAGTLVVEGTDFAASDYDVFNPNTPWVALNFPNTTTAVTQAVLTGSNTYNIQLSNTGIKWIRVRYNATSGTGIINAAVTCRANSRT